MWIFCECMSWTGWQDHVNTWKIDFLMPFVPKSFLNGLRPSESFLDDMYIWSVIFFILFLLLFNRNNIDIDFNIIFVYLLL